MTGLIKPLVRILIDEGVEGVPPTPAYCYTVTESSSTSNPTNAGGLSSSIIFSYQGGYYEPDHWSGTDYVGVPPDAVPVTITTASNKSSASSGTIVTQTNTCVPASPGVEAIPPAYDNLTNVGWNAGATSVDNLTGNGQIIFTAPTNPIGIIVGLNNYNQTAHYIDIKYGIYFHNNIASVFESGVESTSVTFVDIDEFAISRQDGVIYYIKNGTPFASTTTTITDTLFVDVSFYGLGDSISGVEISDSEFYLVFSEIDFTASSSFDIEPTVALDFNISNELEVFGILDGEVYGSTDFTVTSDLSVNGQAEYPVVLDFTGTATLRVAEHTTVTQILPAIESFSYDYPYGRSDVQIGALTSESYGGWITPTFSYSYNYISPIISSSTGLTGIIGGDNLDLSPLISLSSETSYAEGDAELSALSSWAGELSDTDGVALISVPEITMDGWGYVSASNGLNARFPSFELEGSFGGQLDADTPEFTLSASASSDLGVVGTADIIAPEFTLNASVLIGSIGVANLSVDLGIITDSYSGWRGSFIVPKASVTASGLTGSVGTANLIAPLFTLTASATDEVFGSAEFDFPQVYSLYGTASFEFPRMYLSAKGSLDNG